MGKWSKEARIVRKMSGPNVRKKSSPKEVRTPLGTEIYLPNHSGKHDAALYSFPDGGVVFAQTYKLTENKEKLFWDNKQFRLGIGTSSPETILHVNDTVNNGVIRFEAGSGEWDFGVNRTTGRLTFTNVATATVPFKLDPSAPNNAIRIGIAGAKIIDFRDNSQTVVKIDLGTKETTFSGNVKISTTTGALNVPSMTTTQRDALTAANGMIVYNTTTNAFNFYENGSWVTK